MKNIFLKYSMISLLVLLISVILFSNPVLALSIEKNVFGSDAIEINFDDISSDTSVSDKYQSKGVLFENAISIAGTYPVSRPNVISSLDSNPIAINFPTGVTKVGIQIDTDGYNTGRQPQMRAFDLNGELLGTLNFDQGPDFVGFEFSDNLIYKIQLGTTPNVDQSGPFTFSDSYDNLIFELATPTQTSSVLALSIEKNNFGSEAVEINFDDISSDTSVSDKYQSKGVLFENAISIAGTYPVSRPNVISSSDSNPIAINFPTGVTKVGIQIDTDGYNTGRQPQMRAFDLNGELLGTLNFDQGPDFVGFEFSDNLIYRIQLGTTPNVDQSGPFTFSDSYDNLIFELATAFEEKDIKTNLSSMEMENLKDTDGDGWSDEKEESIGTNPYSIDSDNDGINDPQDPNPNVPKTNLPGFEGIFAIFGLLTIAYLKRKSQ